MDVEWSRKAASSNRRLSDVSSLGDMAQTGPVCCRAVTYKDSDKTWHASMNATADQLKAAPEFKYGGRWSGSRS
jgi:hypothetical protein